MTTPEETPRDRALREVREQQRHVLEKIAGQHDTAHGHLRASLLALRGVEGLFDLDVYAVAFVERELNDVLLRMDGVRFAIERLHGKTGRS